MAPLLRFAPSPTGPLHLGGLRTALINHLYARKNGGKWILRIEDTDAARTVPGSLEGIKSGLGWAGLDYDYGPGKPGPHGPYFQSERLDLYHQYAKKLLENGHGYRCFCSPTRLAETRERLARSGSNASYDKACLSLTEEESTRRARAGEKFVIRLNDSNLPERDSPDDVIFGKVKDAHSSLATDPVLLKSDKFPTYHLANIVDDHEMGITHVIRGEEWLASLPMHLDLYAVLGLKPPQFAHLPLLLNPDGTKMSKRHGDVRVEDYISQGWEPAAVLNWLALAGWGVAHDNEHTLQSGQKHEHKATAKAPNSTTIFTLRAMVKKFDLSAVTHRRNVLDPYKLERFNKAHLGMQPKGALAERARKIVLEAFPKSQHTETPYLEKVVEALLHRLPTLHELPIQAPYFFVDPPAPSRALMSTESAMHAHEVAQAAVKRFSEVTPERWDRQTLATVLKNLAREENLGKSVVVKAALRVALTGMKSGPPMPDTMVILGRERTLSILSRVQSSLEKTTDESL
ncbi:glutamyl-tRNA synthetase [Peniophora sp. CONT]|nr:glutamyl-tRNA synthetase [Peniophora sp. CONT]